MTTDLMLDQKLRQTMRLWATGVTIVSAAHNDLLRGMTVSSFTSVTLEPPLVLVCVQKVRETAEVILASQAFAVSMLGEDDTAISNLFAGFTPETDESVNRFDGLEVQYAVTGSPILANAMGWLDCKLREVYDGSTHHIFVGEVVAASGSGDSIEQPLLYYNRAYRKIGGILD